MREEWKTIPGYENYEASTFGNIRRKENGRLLKQQSHFKNYRRVDLCRNGKRTHCKVHRLIAETFIPNPDKKPQVNHRDFDVTNNRVWNLEWVTDEENKAYTRQAKEDAKQ